MAFVMTARMRPSLARVLGGRKKAEECGIRFTGDGRLDKGLVGPLVGTSRRSYSVVVQSRLIFWLM